MSEMPRSWFSNPRPLPLDKNGKVDFSLDVVSYGEKDVSGPDPQTAERYLGRMFDQLWLPNGDRIVLLYRWDSSDPGLPLHTANHNVFRLKANNEVVWQVRRDDQGHMNWEYLNQEAKEADPTSEGYMDPFTNMSTGFFERRPTGLTGPFQPKVEKVYFEEWAPGRLVWLTTRWWGYDLDPETGIATCTGEQVK